MLVFVWGEKSKREMHFDENSERELKLLRLIYWGRAFHTEIVIKGYAKRNEHFNRYSAVTS